MGIAEGLSALKNAMEIGRTISQRVKEGKLQATEITEQILFLQQYILDSQRALNDAAEEIRLLKEQAATQKRNDDIENDLEWINDGGWYIRKSELDAGKHIPYCPLCWKDNGKLVPLQPSTSEGWYQCVIHKSVHETKAHHQASLRAISGFHRDSY
jgi:hypothetical protein